MGLLAAVALLLAPRDARAAAAEARRARDAGGALGAPLLYAWTKWAAAAGILVAALREPRPPAAPNGPDGRAPRARRIDFFAWRPQSNATARCRGAAYAPLLRERGITLRFLPPAPDRLYRALSERRGAVRLFTKPLYYLIVLAVRIGQLLRSGGADAVIVQRELYPFGPPLLEGLLARRRVPLLYDFDDALDQPPPHLRGFAYRFHDWSKFEKIARRARWLLAASPRLAARGRRTGTPTLLLPTPVDTERIHPSAAPPRRRPPVWGWIGSGGNLTYLEQVTPQLRALQQRRGGVLRVISDRPFRAAGLRVENVRWCLAREAEALWGCDVGLMPLTENEYARAKGGHKILVYWAAGLPVIASPVGVNAEMISHGEDGLLADGPAAWREALERLAGDAALRRRMGARGRRKVVARYSQRACARTLADLIDRVLCEEV
ncbi:MAG: glycosyltransferase [Candidatus Eisenbacteria bacterium]|nr:glycosyltransferase [Candidatus Eisenbacteria bacterium]